MTITLHDGTQTLTAHQCPGTVLRLGPLYERCIVELENGNTCFAYRTIRNGSRAIRANRTRGPWTLGELIDGPCCF